MIDNTGQIVWQDWRLDIDADQILRGQGADPVIVRQRKPRLLELAERAREDGARLIAPRVLHRTLPVTTLRHDRLILADGTHLISPLLARHLAPAQFISVIVCTIGPELEQTAGALMRDNPAYALALDGYGSAAVEALGTAACHRLEIEAAARQQCTSVPLNPGMVDWDVGDGQPLIFKLLDTAPIGVVLNASAQMIPYKSASMVLGFSASAFESGVVCDFCALRATCRYQDRARRHAS